MVNELRRSAGRPTSPEPEEQRIGQPFDETHRPGDRGAGETNDDERRCEPDEAAGRDISWVVGADEDPSDGDEDGGGHEDRAGHAIKEENGEGDPEGRACVIAGKRRVV